MDPTRSTPFLPPSHQILFHSTSMVRRPLASAIVAGSSPVVSTSTLRKGLGPNKAGTRDGFLAYTLQDATIFIFQLVALTVALVFAAWVIKSYDAALRANNLSNQSDQAALKGNDLSDRSLQMALSSNQAADHQASFQSQRVSLQNQVVLAQG